MPEMIDDDSGNDPFGGARLQFPVSFELRIIYVLAQGALLEPQVLEILQKQRAAPQLPRTLPASGSTYGRMAVPVCFADEASMRAAYAAIGVLPGVKALL
ncbi:MAG: hypothetical protein A2087_13155 [Spirochaetes bacterium GWD1_61_31]|nr:MAG: hypothetical protein A2Y37_02560 [Spirochaetes bacterium GWB1_60_80]OHD28587.1 MAG: hypothetical protein A2004_03135 [Spirochaetes bacterium GWC1_61_12]OHD39444.1 MAG: hypothetical protein A2087_13155 [Spirochaetes bacterium GWD1_61_31]OHD45497.1 MAG: hypothetical protein A2Y35_02830 [Spirochaetes bacterium GWE1_60_18]OHD58071.1 MAG: hypothetical protein A2Y32_05405 [Spirochaetes bacterium GWF1_60_12]HAP44638.1 hypothetical protein [Spirochaetaceae bacterium]